MMFRVYTSTFVLICVVTQALTDLPEGFCQRETRFYQQVSKQAPRVCKKTRRYCFKTFPRPSCYYIAEFYQQVSKQAPRVCKKTRRYCFKPFPRPSCYYIAEYYECMYVQYKQTAKIKQVDTCCDGYSYRNGKCEKDSVNVTPETTWNTCLCNDTRTNDTTEDAGNVTEPAKTNRKGGESKDTADIITVLVAALSVVIVVAVIISWKVRHRRKQKNQSRSDEMEIQPTRNMAGNRNVAHEIGEMELGAENRIYFQLEPHVQGHMADECITDGSIHDTDSTGNPYDTIDRRNRYSTEADPMCEDVDGQGVPDNRYESDIYHHLDRNPKETYNTDVYGILSGVELSQI